MKTVFLAGAALFFGSTAAIAQRANDNVTTQSKDAFGKRVGDEQIGVYNPYDVRGFSAIEAGNTRIEGLYFAEELTPTDRLLDSTTMRVGISAQGYPFPAPTGIVDYSLRKPGEKPAASMFLRFGPFKSQVGQLDISVPLDGARLGAQLGIDYANDNTHFGATPQYLSVALTSVWRPREGVEVIPFWNTLHTNSQEAITLIFTAGDYLPPRINRNRFTGQPWAIRESTGWNSGLVVKASTLGIDVAAGAFRSIVRDKQTAIDLLLGTTTDGNAERLVILDEGNRYAASSGELRASKSMVEGKRRHTLIASLRGRDQRRLYGDGTAASLGSTRLGEEDFRARPEFVFGPKNRDHVTQVGAAAGYQLQWAGVGEFGLGIQKVRYRKSVLNTSGPEPVSRASPWLFNANAAIDIAPRLAVYASLARGLEESAVAPERATNRNQAPPAIRTAQKDAGIRWAITDNLSAIAGVFEITKPYFNLDGADRFRKLGDLRHRGIELSLAGEIAKGLNIVAGTVLLDAKVSGELVDAGEIGSKPVGAVERHSIVSLDYRFANSPVSVDLFMDESGDRVANARNDLVVPPRAVVLVGGRYRFKVGRANAVLRAQLGNIFNKFGWNVGSSGFYTYNAPRRTVVTLTTDL